MAKHWLKFMDVRLLSFAGFFKGKQAEIIYPEGFTPSKDEFDPDGGIVIIFPPEHRYIEAAADQGTGKTSWLNFLKESTGAKMVQKWFNTTDNTRNYERTFVGKNGKHYRVKATKTEFNLFEMQRTEDGEDYQRNHKGVIYEQKVPDAKNMLVELLGPPGLSPMAIAEKEGKEQVEWLKSLVMNDPQLKKAEFDLNKDIKTTYDTRTKVNQEVKRLAQVLESNAYYKEYEGWKKYFNETSFDDIKEQIQTARKNYDQHREMETNLSQLKEDVSNWERECREIEEQIKMLQNKLTAKKEAIEEVQVNITDIDAKVLENAHVVETYNQITDKVEQATVFNAKKQSFDQMENTLQEYNHQSDESIRLTNRLDQLREAKQKFIASITPDVPGLEVFIPDEEQKKEGLEYNGKPLNMLCESDQWEWFTPLCKACGIQALYIENVSSLGTGAIEKFNEFIQEGGYVFGSRMDRSVKHFRLTFHSKIPL
jgi:hypothetical protein